MCLVGGGSTPAVRHSNVARIVPSSPARVFVLAILVAVLSANVALAAPFSEIVSFDSSLTDNGNLVNYFQSNFGIEITGPPYHEGRISNGLVYIEYMAQQLGLPMPVASDLGGKNYSFGGALAGPGFTGTEFAPPGWPNVGEQINRYLNDYTPTGSELVVISGGQNNLFDPSYTNDVAVPVNYMMDHITTLANAGINNFLVATLAPLGQLPETRGGPNEAYHDQLATDFNALLKSELAVLDQSLAVDISILDIHAVYTDMLANPGDYGFTNVTNPAYDGQTLVSNPEEYLFWDAGHPTTVTHAHLANAGVQALGFAPVPVPEPSTIVMGSAALFSFLVLGLRRRKQR